MEKDLEYFNLQSGAALIDTDYTSLRWFLGLHGMKPDAWEVDRAGKRRPLYLGQSLEKLRSVHNTDKARRGTKAGRAPKEFGWTDLSGTGDD